MFCASPGSFSPDFQPETFLESIQQIECYKARAKALNGRFPWSDALRPVWHASLVHSSANVPGKVAYYATVKALMDNRLTRTSPEMFLERVLQYAPDNIKIAWGSEVLGRVLPTIHFVENTDPDGWFEVYNDGPRSCMQGASTVRQYAHPKNNLALAYIENGSIITHRTIINKERKTYLRIYGVDAGQFVAALAQLGYKRDEATLQGELINLDYTTCCCCDNEVLIGPYLDGSSQGVRTINRSEGTIGGFMDLNSDDEPSCGHCSDGDSDNEW